MIENLSNKNVRTIISQYQTDGHAPLKVLTDNFETFVLKFRNNSYDNSSIIKEFLCHYFLKCWEIPTPNISVLYVPDEILKHSDIITVREKSLISKSVCFGSELLSQSIEITELFNLKGAYSQKRICNLSDVFKIALFDIWIENDDRKSINPNLLLDTSKSKIIINAIDHAYTFSSLEFKELNYTNHLNYSYNENILFASFAKSIINKTKIDNDFLKKYRDLFYLCINIVKTNFYFIVDNIPENLTFTSQDKTKLYDFLFNDKRNIEVFREFNFILDKLKK